MVGGCAENRVTLPHPPGPALRRLQTHHPLVLCSQSLFRFPDLGDDGIGRRGPHERSRVLIPPMDVCGDGFDELIHTGNREAFELAHGELAEEALHQVQPRS